MENQTRRPMTREEEERVRFWVEALVRGKNPSSAAQQLHAIGIRTRGAVRTRGSVRVAAPSRFPPGTSMTEILGMLQRETTPELRCDLAAALAEFGGGEALAVLEDLVLGQHRDRDVGVRAAALDAIGLIGGAQALNVLERVSTTDDDATMRHIATGLIESLREA